MVSIPDGSRKYEAPGSKEPGKGERVGKVGASW